jgi:electron transfer flavoprotein beta subunit
MADASAGGCRVRILACIKQVPDTESPLSIDEDSLWIREDDRIAFRMNRYDEYALEEAVLIREALDDVTIDAISVGPVRAATVLKKSFERGATNGIHIVRETPGYCPPAITASLLADYARNNSYDLIFTGVMAEDDMQCQVGPLLAARLGLPCAVSVVKESISLADRTITVESEIEGGAAETVILPMPCLLTIQSGINRPRYPSLSNVLRAKEQELIRIFPEGDAMLFTTEKALSLSYPVTLTHGTIIEGSTEEKAEKLLTLLHEESLL